MTSVPVSDPGNFPQAVLIIDDDEMIASLLADYLTGMGATQIEMAHDGNAAWDLIRQKSFGLLILDWKLPGPAGLALFNRLRQLPAYTTVPVCISSGLLTREDCFLLDEYPTTGLVEKPFTEDVFAAAVAKLVAESAWQAANLARLTEIIATLADDTATATADLTQLIKSSPNPIPIAISAGRVLREHKRYPEAEALLKKAVERDPGSILALSELGKVLVHQGNAAEARVILQKAQEMSPKNLSRLTLLGELELTGGNPERAARYFKQALSIDQDDGKAATGLVTAETVARLPENLRGGPDIMHSMAGLLNVTAIALIKEGQHDKAIQQYQAAFHYSTENGDKARVAFNLGLGFLRWNRPDNAVEWFRQAVTLSSGGHAKASGYLERLKRSGGPRPAPTVVDDGEEFQV